MDNYRQVPEGHARRRPIIEGFVHDRSRPASTGHVFVSRDQRPLNSFAQASVQAPSAPALPTVTVPNPKTGAYNPDLKPVAEPPKPIAVAARPVIQPKPPVLVPPVQQQVMQPQPAAARPQTMATPVRPARISEAERPILATGPTASRYPAIDMSLPGAAELIKQPSKFKHHKFYRLRTWLFRSVVTTMILVIAVGSLLFTQGFLKVHKSFKGGASAAALQQDVSPHKLRGEGDGRINAVFATAKYNYLGKIDTSSKDENAIKAGLSAIDQNVEDVLGITIHYNVMLDFTAFRQAIDTVGGVDVNVREALIDPTMAWENNHNPVLAKAGPQHFDGKQALMYVRSRHTSSDFARSERQRAVLIALKDKIMNLGTLSNPLKISELISAFGNNVYSDFSMSDTLSVARIFKGINNQHIKSIGLAEDGAALVTTAMVGDQSTVQPKAGMFDFSEIRTYVRSQLIDGYIKKENAKVVVLNGTPQEGLATEKADLLKSYGYNVVKVDNAPTNSYTNTVIVDQTGGKAKYTKNYLEKRFNVRAATKLPDSAILPGDADFIIILGSNEASSSEN